MKELGGNRREFIVIVAGSFHHEIADRLQRIAYTGNPHNDIRAGIEIMKSLEPKVIEDYSNIQQVIDDIKHYKTDFDFESAEMYCQQTAVAYSTLLEGIRDTLSLKDKSQRKLDFIELTRCIPDAVDYSKPVIDHDDRPWYEKAANKGGKKRKQNYNNRQPWKR